METLNLEEKDIIDGFIRENRIDFSRKNSAIYISEKLGLRFDLVSQYLREKRKVFYGKKS